MQLARQTPRLGAIRADGSVESGNLAGFVKAVMKAAAGQTAAKLAE
jgi:hypothetical protein